MNIHHLVDLLNLEPLPHEGGYFCSTYKSEETIPHRVLPPRYQQDMAFGTAIYYLLTPTDFSAMHRLSSDEIFHFYLGDPVEMLLLHPDGAGEVFVLGNDLLNGMRPQKVVSHDVWQGSRLVSGGRHGFALVGTTMAPGFDWAGFELGRRQTLIEQYPAFTALIEARIRV